jgi:hypothetical protein
MEFKACYSLFIAWASTGDVAIPVAADAGNPWESAPTCTAGDEDDSWANFSKADFDNPCIATPMEISDSPSTGNTNFENMCKTDTHFSLCYSCIRRSRRRFTNNIERSQRILSGG